MKSVFSTTASIFITLLFVSLIVYAFTEPTAPAPQDNVPAPLNVGTGRQTKLGDISLNNLTANSITLGGDTRTTWPFGAGTACSWEGTKCDCDTDHYDAPRGYITVGATCSGGVLTGVDIIEFGVSNISSIGCRREPLPVCNAGYTRN